jgi:hypothetical protein
MADVSRFQKLLGADGLDGGTAGAVTNANPSSAVFLRLDAPVSRWNSRITARASYSYGDSSIFARPTALAPTNCSTNACFPLSSLQHSRWVGKRSAGIQVVSNFASGAYNELLVGYTGVVSGFRPTVKEPLVLVTVPGTGGSPAVLQSGTHEIATGQRNASWTTEFTDNLSLSAGAHRITAGLSAQLFDLRAFQQRGAYGVWEFASLDSLQAGIASRYRVTRDTGSVTAAKGSYRAVYVGDEWDASPRLSLTLGLRSDMPLVSANLPYVSAVDSALHLRTDALPSRQAQWSPRLGFTYELTTQARHRHSTRTTAIRRLPVRPVRASALRRPAKSTSSIPICAYHSHCAHRSRWIVSFHSVSSERSKGSTRTPPTQLPSRASTSRSRSRPTTTGA